MLCILESEDGRLTGFQLDRRQSRREQTNSRAAVLVCLILLALLTFVQVAHVHDFDSNADQCPLCIAMHSAAPVVAIVAAIVLIEIATANQVVKVRAVVRPWHPTLFNRPPPSGR